jgi:hypothetical protein
VKACAPWDGDVLTPKAAAAALASGQGQGTISPSSQTISEFRARGNSSRNLLNHRDGANDDDEKSEISSSHHAPPRRRKSVMFDLDDDDESSSLQRRSSDGSQLSRVDPMPLDEGSGLDWSRVVGDDDEEAIESGDEYDDD